MKLLFIFSLSVLIGRSLGGCITVSDPQNPRDKQLGLVTAGLTHSAYADSDATIYARIWYGPTETSGQWSTWRYLDNKQCDDYEHGATDYFDDFDGISQRWWAISLFMCGTTTDGLLLEGVYYWRGQSNGYISRFCENIASPWAECQNGPSSSNLCGIGSPVNAYTRMWIDADNYLGCNGITFKTGSTATPFTFAHPGRPDCSGEVGR